MKPPMKPVPPPSRVLCHGREVDPVTYRWKDPTAVEALGYAIWDAGVRDLARVKWALLRTLRRWNWLRETGEWPVLCANTACFTVIQAGATHCDRHQRDPFKSIFIGFEPVIYNVKDIQVNMLGDGYTDSSQTIRAIMAVLDDMARVEGIRCDYLAITATAGPYGLVRVEVTNQKPL